MELLSTLFWYYMIAIALGFAIPIALWFVGLIAVMIEDSE